MSDMPADQPTTLPKFKVGDKVVKLWITKEFPKTDWGDFAGKVERVRPTPLVARIRGEKWEYYARYRYCSGWFFESELVAIEE